MELIDITNLPKALKRYGGMSCSKQSINLNGNLYMIKFPGNLKNKNFKNISRSFSNSPICEYIGSHIYEIFGLPTHETLLAKCEDKVVVLCKDFEGSTYSLQDFRSIRVGHVESMDLSDEFMHSHGGGSLNSILSVCDNDAVLKDVPGVNTRIFEYITLDGFIGNFDRNNGNWGILIDTDTHTISKLAPVYDNGSCLYDKWSDTKMQKYLYSEKDMYNYAVSNMTSYFTKGNGKKYNPFKLLKSCLYPLHVLVGKGLFRKNVLPQIFVLIDSVEVLTEVQREFYKRLLEIRYDEYVKITSEITLDIDTVLNVIQRKLGDDTLKQVIDYIHLCGDAEEALVNLYANGLLKL